MTEDQIKEKERQKALELVTKVEAHLGNLYQHLDAFCTGEEQDYRDKRDNVERCMQMVLGQVLEAWTHAGRAKKRLIALSWAEGSSSPASEPEGVILPPPGYIARVLAYGHDPLEGQTASIGQQINMTSANEASHIEKLRQADESWAKNLLNEEG